MTKNAFIKRLAAHFGSRRQASEALDTILEAIGDALEHGEDVNLTGFGRFHVANRGARRGVHPRSGEPMTIPAMRVPRFTAGAPLKAKVKS